PDALARRLCRRGRRADGGQVLDRPHHRGDGPPQLGAVELLHVARRRDGRRRRPLLRRSAPRALPAPRRPPLRRGGARSCPPPASPPCVGGGVTCPARRRRAAGLPIASVPFFSLPMLTFALFVVLLSAPDPRRDAPPARTGERGVKEWDADAAEILRRRSAF